jgi:hypothetical protein
VGTPTITNRYGIYQADTGSVNHFEGNVESPILIASEFNFASSFVSGGAYLQQTSLGRGFQARVKPVVLPAELVFAASFNETSAASEFAVYGLVLPPLALPSAPATGALAVDFADSNKLKWYNGSSWRTVSDALSNLGVPSAEGADRTLTNADNTKNLICTGTRIFTVNTGLVSGFGCSFKGTVSFTGTATVTDVRTTGATNPWCALCATGTDTYDIVGSKA